MNGWMDSERGAAALLAGMPRALADALKPYVKTAFEIRMRAARPVTVSDGRAPIALPITVSAQEVQRLADTLCGRALYAHQESAACGYVTLRGGHRMGLCGQVILENGRVWQLRSIGSICVRVARDVRGASESIRSAVQDHGGARSALILGRPGSGKTTVMRDLARCLSERGVNVCIADERCELAACENGVPSLDVGSNTDVLPGLPKAAAVEWMLRAMCPRLIVMDELYGREDTRAVFAAMRAGVPVLATAHAEDLCAARARPDIRALLDSGAFERIILMRSAHEPPELIA